MTYSDMIRQRLLEMITARGITVNKLATQSGITQSTVENVVAGRDGESRAARAPSDGRPWARTVGVK